jgi:hypothetical protein
MAELASNLAQVALFLKNGINIPGRKKNRPVRLKTRNLIFCENNL